MCETVILIRNARATDETARAALVRTGLSSSLWDAFLLFYFQELTLQSCVLCGAVLFIFCGASLSACSLLPPLAGLIVASGVYIEHLTLAEKNLQNIRKEESGFVAEVYGTMATATAPPLAFRLLMEPAIPPESAYSQVVGTVSLSQYWGPGSRCWIHALAVHPQWQRRGIGRALVLACDARAAAAGRPSLECIVSQLQQPARTLLHSMGWEMRGSYQRPIAGSALTLLVARLGIELPTA